MPRPFPSLLPSPFSRGKWLGGYRKDGKEVRGKDAVAALLKGARGGGGRVPERGWNSRRGVNGNRGFL